MDPIKESISKKYTEVANSGRSCCGDGAANCMAEAYPESDTADVGIANLGLGCGTPTSYAGLREGMTVLDLGSGAGIDVFIASEYVGLSGKAIGIDMTQAMIDRALSNASALGIQNVEFLLGEIECLPLSGETVDRVISNCVINLVPDKRKVFAEIFRVLKAGGDFVVSDIVSRGSIPDTMRQDHSLWAGCISGAIDLEEYLGIIRAAGFRDVTVVSEKTLPDYSRSSFALMSATVRGSK